MPCMRHLKRHTSLRASNCHSLRILEFSLRAMWMSNFHCFQTVCASFWSPMITANECFVAYVNPLLVYPPPPCISYVLVQTTVGVGTVIIVYVILITYEL